MTVDVFLFVFVFFLLSLALFWHLGWLHLQSSHARGGAKRSRLPRLLKPRCPDDCPACRLTCTASSGGETAPGPVRPWREVKSRRGAPKRVNTEGYACPNQQCKYFGTTDADTHALVGDGKHGRAEQIQTLRCLQLDELRTRLRSATQILWLWLVIDPLTKMIPVLYRGPRTQHAAHLLIHSLRQMLAAFLPAPVHQRWLELVLLCASQPISVSGFR